MNKQHSDTSSMTKTMIELCLISARGLPRQTLLKHQWYAVGWVNPTNKYCTTIDASGNPNPVWKTKFTTVVDNVLDSCSLHVEVYSREPVFLREKLQGTASINLKEFLSKYSKNCVKFGECKDGNNEDVGSFQLRKKNGKPLGLIDVSVKVSENEGASSYSFVGEKEGFNLHDNGCINLQTGPPQGYTGQPATHPCANPTPYPRNYSHPLSYPPATGPSYPPPLSECSYVPTFLPQGTTQSTSYMNMPSSSGAGRGAGIGPGFAVGLGAGALAAGAVIYGGDFMSGFELPSVMPNHNIGFSMDPPF